MADPKPSLTPHRDAVEKNIAKCTPPDNWQEAASGEMIFAVHRVLADQLDAGRTARELVRFLPKALRAVAINGLAVCGASNAFEAAPHLLVDAAGPLAAPDEVIIHATLRPAAGGRA